jgi:hypothetical protein
MLTFIATAMVALITTQVAVVPPTLLQTAMSTRIKVGVEGDPSSGRVAGDKRIILGI